MLPHGEFGILFPFLSVRVHSFGVWFKGTARHIPIIHLILSSRAFSIKYGHVSIKRCNNTINSAHLSMNSYSVILNSHYGVINNKYKNLEQYKASSSTCK